jgi:REP element-mobilizing transposase RayT
MARRIEVPGGIHHVTARGNLRRRLFYDERDYRFFLLKLGDAERRFGWEIRDMSYAQPRPPARPDT